MNNLKPTLKRVKVLLERRKDLRDNDRSLIALIWQEDAKVGGYRINRTRHFLQAFEAGLLTNPETIRRARQRVQEKHPHLASSKHIEQLRRVKAIEVRQTINQS